MAARPELSGGLAAWPVHEASLFEWRRVRRWRGSLPVEVSLSGTPVGRLLATDPIGRRYAARTASTAWDFAARGLWRQRCEALAVDSVVACAVSEKEGFRRRAVRLASGPKLDWRQFGFRGDHYRLSTAHDGAELLAMRNRGGALRWHGVIEVGEPALDLGDLLPLAVLFSTFLVFSSSELSV